MEDLHKGKANLQIVHVIKYKGILLSDSHQYWDCGRAGKNESGYAGHVCGPHFILSHAPRVGHNGIAATDEQALGPVKLKRQKALHCRVIS